MIKIGVFGDVHANLEALSAVLGRLTEEGCDSFICTGDIVGYGPNPAECVALMRERDIPCVLGNHDHYVTLLMDPRLERLRDTVRTSIQWTQSMLSMGDLRWLAQLPKRLDFDTFSVIHGSFGPSPWAYLVDERTVTRNFEYQDMPLAFCGHSHQTLLAFQKEESAPQLQYLKHASLPHAPKVIVNAGSVGQPRDHDPRAACAVFETELHEIKPIRVPYDIEATQARMTRYGLPQSLIKRLALGT